MTRRIKKKRNMCHFTPVRCGCLCFSSHRRYAVTIEMIVSLGRAAYTYVSVDVVGRNRSVSIWVHNTRTIKLLYIVWKCQTTTRPHTTSEVEHTPPRNSVQGTRFHEQLSLIDNSHFSSIAAKLPLLPYKNAAKSAIEE